MAGGKNDDVHFSRNTVQIPASAIDRCQRRPDAANALRAGASLLARELFGAYGPILGATPVRRGGPKS
jgi:hypothetical protein